MHSFDFSETAVGEIGCAVASPLLGTRQHSQIEVTLTCPRVADATANVEKLCHVETIPLNFERSDHVRKLVFIFGSVRPCLHTVRPESASQWKDLTKVERHWFLPQGFRARRAVVKQPAFSLDRKPIFLWGRGRTCLMKGKVWGEAQGVPLDRFIIECNHQSHHEALSISSTKEHAYSSLFSLFNSIFNVSSYLAGDLSIVFSRLKHSASSTTSRFCFLHSISRRHCHPHFSQRSIRVDPLRLPISFKACAGHRIQGDAAYTRTSIRKLSPSRGTQMMMHFSLALLPLLVGMSNALTQAASASCATVTSEVIVPTTTVTYTTTPIRTIYASTAEDLGTFIDTIRIASTSTVATVTSTVDACNLDATGAAV